jgi:predicted dehydrogenase
VGLGQIGCGYDIDLAHHSHVMTHSRACHLHPALSIIGVVDPSEKARIRYSRSYPGPTFASIQEASKISPIDLIILAAPTSYHPRLLNESLNLFSPKAILCEKPLAASLPEAVAMVRACENYGVQLFVNYMRCVEPGAVQISRLFHDRTWLPPYAAVMWYSKGFLHNGSHLWTLAERWFGPTKYARVTSRESNWGDGDARCVVRAIHEQAVVHYLPVPDGPLSHHSIEVMASNGRLRFDHGGKKITWESRADGVPPTSLSHEISAIPSDFDRFQWHVADALVAALDERPHDLCTGAEALGGLSRLIPLLEA